MSIFAATFVVLLFLLRHSEKVAVPPYAAITLRLFPKVTASVSGRFWSATVFLFDELGLVRRLGLLAPFALLAWMAGWEKRYSLGAMNLICRTLIVFEGDLFRDGAGDLRTWALRQPSGNSADALLGICFTF